MNININILKQLNVVPLELNEKIVFGILDVEDNNVKHIIKKYYPNAEFVKVSKEEIEKKLKFLESKEKIKTFLEEIKRELREIETSKTESAIKRFIYFILKDAIDKKASDIHIEAGEESAEVRYRIFGSLYKQFEFDLEIFATLSSGIKLISNLNVSEKRKPQDGAFSFEYKNLKFDFRVSTLPTVWGESIVIRILDKRNIQKDLDNLGISEKNLKLVKKALKSPNGIFLVTGPTGSGKSTTLYAALKEVAGSDVKVITVEDPVEYKVKGIQQVQVSEKIGLTFPVVLKSILRQDPDVILIGEIRDKKTLEIAIKAAFTGHLVISTLHTNDSISAISRMVDMGIEPFFVSNALIGVLAQRLVKKICQKCKVSYKPKDEFIEPIKHMLPKEALFYKGMGCEECNMTGYAGMSVISEVFLVDEEMESLIARNVSKKELLKYLKSNGFKNMFVDGLSKALKGITTLEEVYRVAKIL